MMQGNQFILLHPDDNVLVCRKFCASGCAIELDGEVIVLRESIGVGHKIARLDLLKDATVYKHGASIGVTTARIKRGTHVHLSNLASNYIRSHSRSSAFDEDFS